MKTYVHTKMHAQIFITGLFVIAPHWEQPRVPQQVNGYTVVHRTYNTIPHQRGMNY